MPVGKKVFKTILLFRDLRLLMLIPIFIYSGLEQSFNAGIFTKGPRSFRTTSSFLLFILEVVSASLGPGQIGFVMAAYGLTNVVFSFSLGRMADRFGLWVGLSFPCHVDLISPCPQPLIGTGTVSHGLVFAVLFYLECSSRLLPFSIENPWFVYMCALLLGVGDAAWNTFPNTVLGLVWPENAEAAFSNLKLWQSVGSSPIFLRF